MKIRMSFVSNSSSCSFTIKKGELKVSQLEALRETLLEKDLTRGLLGPLKLYKYSGWSICETEEKITGSLIGDDNGMKEYLNKELKIPLKKIRFKEYDHC